MSLALMGAGKALDAAGAAGTAYATEVLADSPVGYWRLNDTSGTVAATAVGVNAGTYVNAPTLGVAGLIANGTAVTFAAASSQEMTIPSTGLSTTGTVEFWFRWTAGATLMRDNTTTAGWIIGFDNAGTFTVRVGTTTTIATSKTTAQVQDGTIHHLVVAKNGANVTIYLDNVVIGTSAAAASTGSSGVWHIARNGASAGVYTDMTADEVAIYTTELLAARVAAHWNARVVA
jgi:hypothetical protein